MKNLVPLLLALFVFLTPSASAQLNGVKLSFTLKQEHGSTFGYVHPKVNSKVTLVSDQLPKDQITFAGPDSGYIPLPAPLKIIDVDRYNSKDREWSSFRAVSQDGTHKVTMDVSQKGSSNGCDAFVTVEYRNRVIGSSI